MAFWIGTACLAIGALSSFHEAARAAEVITPADRALYADVNGRVVDDRTGAPLPGVPVSLLYETVVTGQDGAFSFQKIPMIHTAQISLRVATDEGLVIGCTTFDIPVRYYPIASVSGDLVDVKLVEPGVDGTVELRLKNVGMPDVGAYCTTCHMHNPCVETTNFRTVVTSGKDLRGIIVKESQLDKYRELLKQRGVAKDSYTKIRDQDTHPKDMDLTEVLADTGRLMGQFQLPQNLKLYKYTERVNGKEVHRQKVICDTCHTRHEPTQQRQYVLLPFDDNSQLCYQCHK